MDTTTIRKMIRDHQHYLLKDVEGWEKMRADFSNQIIPPEFDFNRANLEDAIFDGARLYECDMSRCMLRNASFHRADLYRIDLHLAYLLGADLSYSDMKHANLTNACLWGANLDHSTMDFVCAPLAVFDNCSMIGTCLHEAIMAFSSFNNAIVRPSNCNHTVWNGARMQLAKESPDIPMACPEIGSFIGYKACAYDGSRYIVVLEIPEDALRSSGTVSKCRCSKAKVIDIQNLDGTKANVPYVYSFRDSEFKYSIGKTVVPDAFNGDRFNICSNGIHFFMTRAEAVNYC